MKYPEFREAEYSTTDIPVYNREKHYMFIALKCIAFIVIFFIIILITHYFFKIIMLETTEGIYLNAVSVGASIVTVFSALITVLSLLESNCLKKYDNDLHLLENRYLNGRRISGWEFLHRCSYYTIKSKKNNNYYIDSACYKLYSGNNDSQSLEIIVPALDVDFRDVPCIVQIFRIKKFIPEYLCYLNNEQRNYNNYFECGKLLDKQPNFYIPLPYNIIALYKKILEHKILKYAVVFCFLFIISAIIVTSVYITDYSVIFNVLSSQ